MATKEITVCDVCGKEIIDYDEDYIKWSIPPGMDESPESNILTGICETMDDYAIDTHVDCFIGLLKKTIEFYEKNKIEEKPKNKKANTSQKGKK
jgi:hypothetical protein